MERIIFYAPPVFDKRTNLIPSQNSCGLNLVVYASKPKLTSIVQAINTFMLILFQNRNA